MRQNWTYGRYTVLPPLRGHREKVTTIDSNGKQMVGIISNAIYVYAWFREAVKVFIKLEWFAKVFAN